MITTLTGLTSCLDTEKKLSLFSVVVIGILLFFAWTLAYAVIVYEQFSWLQIVTVSALFMIMLFLFMYFFTGLFKDSLVFSSKSMLYALVLFALMVLLASTFSPMADTYVHTYPLLETEVGLGWHQDTAFHVSHIQSILHFGYPSIGQHGVPLNMYHVLSHYMDAVIVWVAQVEPYDSYGLLVTFKIWLLISSIAVFFVAAIKNAHPLFCLFVFVLLAPILTGTWHAVLSHGLWFTTVLVIFSALKVFQLLTKKELSNKDYYFILILLLLVSLGKVSTGLMYAALVGFFLLIKYPKDRRIYLLGVLLGAFFAYYSSLFQTEIIESTASSYDFSVLSLEYYWTTIIHPTLALEHMFPQNLMIHISIAILIMLTLLFKDKNTILFLGATIVSYLVLVTLVGISVKFGPSDVFYFYLGFTYVLNLLVFMFVVYNIKEKKVLYGVKHNNFYFGLWLILTIVVSSTYLSSALPSSFGKLGVALASINDRPFAKINRILAGEKQVSISKLFAGEVENTVFVSFNRPLYNLRENINQTLVEHKVSKGEALLFIPREVYEKNISKFGGVTWADGMLLYAITGVPMLYAIKDYTHRGYAQGSYIKEYEWKQSASFSHVSACSNNSVKIIIELIGFDTLSFETYHCEQDK